MPLCAQSPPPRRLLPPLPRRPEIQANEMGTALVGSAR